MDHYRNTDIFRHFLQLRASDGDSSVNQVTSQVGPGRFNRFHPGRCNSRSKCSNSSSLPHGMRKNWQVWAMKKSNTTPEFRLRIIWYLGEGIIHDIFAIMITIIVKISVIMMMKIMYSTMDSTILIIYIHIFYISFWWNLLHMPRLQQQHQQLVEQQQQHLGRRVYGCLSDGVTYII